MDLPPAPTPPAGGNAASERTSNLLNLLKFSASTNAQQAQQQQLAQQPPQQPPQQQAPAPVQQHQKMPSQSQGPFPTHIHQPAPGAADPSGLLAALMRGASDQPSPAPPTPQPAPIPPHQSQQQQNQAQPGNPFGNGSPPEDTRSFLLNLLNRPKPSQTESLLTENAQAKASSPQSTDQQPDANSRYAPKQAANASYPPKPEGQQPDVANLLQLIGGGLPKTNGAPNGTASVPGQPALQILKRDGAEPAATQSREVVDAEPTPGSSPHEAARQALDRTSSYQSHHPSQASPVFDADKEPVASAVNDIAGKADRDARAALDRAEKDAHVANEHAEKLAEKDNGKSQSVNSNRSVKETDSLTEKVQTLHLLEDEQGVADSWENADQNEIVVIEEPETPPVNVYNFPMKPWISITLQEDAIDSRPQFREESVMNIARVKKEFDQIDRNLYTASEAYMTYGMSKHGGLRVIRQDDGKDAKVFTDTKDRVFNVSMSVTPSDHDGVHREAIIGTGVGGAVYWVQIKDGEKDHIEDANLEQYGFTLPPLPAQEGDAPSGALKTRARASTSHPEYFAMGRGKCIHFIWPAYILQKNLFKSVHDRVADTEALFKECSLKINTGKAGKDFTFSQDDTVVVSLDKSGRVKFWDVRELTAVKEGSSSRAPLPAHSELEVNEPLMTLASTPEGEKAWPTSVLLLDKQRPYQKRCALRYMIVGMKQNHTLQLWDLALGKPVQEFNLPHSKESDAVCSVMYHPASGMIIIGHPTRNSIYFAHLSAPKYNLKGLSQAEYMQRLAAQDPSIPQPDSTAVISGIREYSFADRGILRSLDILSSPALSSDADEPTLFELYAMHSKGVACILIKQHELGWSRDNKVINAIDAVSAGVVTVSKLRSTQSVEPVTPAEPRAAGRGSSSKDAPQQSTPTNSESAKNGPDFTTSAKSKTDKDTDTPVQSSKENANPTEKPERKSRKKKGKDTDAAASSTPAPTAREVQSAKADVGKSAAANGLSHDVLDSAIASLETRLTASVSDTLKSSLRSLQGKIDDGARVRDESFNHHQLKLLDMVSEVLNDNTQKVLESLIHRQFTELVIPAIGEKASKSVTDILNSKLQPSVVASVQKEIQNAVPQAVNRSLRSGDFVASIADRVGAAVTGSLQQDLVASLTHHLTPALSNAAAQSAQRSMNEIHQQYQEQIDILQSQHRSDSGKIDQLLAHVTHLTDTVTNMANSQAALQAEFLKFKQQQVHELPAVGTAFGSGPHSNVGSQAHSNIAPGHSNAFTPNQGHQAQQYMSSPPYGNNRQVQSPHGSIAPSDHIGPANNVSAVAGAYANQMNRSEADADNDLSQRIQLVEQAIQEGRLQDAIIQWVQSQRKDEIFRQCLSRYPPNRFDNLSPLMLLVVIATLAKDLRLSPLIKDQIDWIEMAVRSFGESVSNQDWERDDFRDVMQSAPATMDMLMSKMTPLLDAMHDRYPTDPFLMKLERGKLERIVQLSNHILDLATNARRYD